MSLKCVRTRIGTEMSLMKRGNEKCSIHLFILGPSAFKLFFQTMQGWLAQRKEHPSKQSQYMGIFKSPLLYLISKALSKLLDVVCKIQFITPKWFSYILYCSSLVRSTESPYIVCYSYDHCTATSLNKNWGNKCWACEDTRSAPQTMQIDDDEIVLSSAVTARKNCRPTVS